MSMKRPSKHLLIDYKTKSSFIIVFCEKITTCFKNEKKNVFEDLRVR